MNEIANVIEELVIDSDLNPELKKIEEWLEKINFTKQIFGGIREEDVWKKIEELHFMYQEVLKAERIRYDTLIEHYRENL